MEFTLPTISIDFSWFANLGQMSLFGIMWTFFIYGGWIPLLYVIAWGLSEIWIIQRQTKYAETIDYVVLAVDIPKGNEQSPKAIENIFSHLSGAKSSINFKEKWWEGRFNSPLSLEWVSIEGYIQFLIRTPIKFRNIVEAAFYAQYPDVEIVEVNDYVDNVSQEYPNEDYEWFGAEMVLKKNSAFPLRTYPQFEHTLSGEFKDPLANFLESMGKMKQGEQFWMQFLIIPGGDALVKDGMAIVDKMTGRERTPKETLIQQGIKIPGKVVSEVVSQIVSSEASKPEKKEGDQFKMLNLTPGERNAIEAIQYKIAKNAFDVKVRWIYYAKKEFYNVGNIYGHMKGFMKQYSTTDLNSLGTYGKTITKGDYFWQKWSVPKKKRAIMEYYKNRDMGSGSPSFILNTEELATIYHFPAIEVKAPLIKKAESRRAEPPFALPVKN